MPQRAFNSAMQVIVEVYTLKVSVYQSLQFRSIQKCHFAEVVATFAWPFGPDVWPFGFGPAFEANVLLFVLFRGLTRQHWFANNLSIKRSWQHIVEASVGTSWCKVTTSNRFSHPQHWLKEPASSQAPQHLWVQAISIEENIRYKSQVSIEEILRLYLRGQKAAPTALTVRQSRFYKNNLSVGT